MKAYRTTPGLQFKPVKATLQIGEVSAESDVTTGAKEVVFNITLKAGKTRMTGLFRTAEDEQYGAYFAYVKKK